MKIITEIAGTVESVQTRSVPPLERSRPAPVCSRPALPLRLRRPLRLARGGALLALAAVLAACVYRMPIRQGNYLDPAAIAQVKPGMTHSQVRYLLGTPMVPVIFDNSRWDYDYYLNLHRLQKPTRAHLTIYFAKDVVARVDSHVVSAPVTYVVRHGIKYATSY